MRVWKEDVVDSKWDGVQAMEDFLRRTEPAFRKYDSPAVFMRKPPSEFVPPMLQGEMARGASDCVRCAWSTAFGTGYENAPDLWAATYANQLELMKVTAELHGLTFRDHLGPPPFGAERTPWWTRSGSYSSEIEEWAELRRSRTDERLPVVEHGYAGLYVVGTVVDYHGGGMWPSGHAVTVRNVGDTAYVVWDSARPGMHNPGIIGEGAYGRIGISIGREL
jgi:hypothetical protein